MPPIRTGICPGCGHYGQDAPLKADVGGWRCSVCEWPVGFDGVHYDEEIGEDYVDNVRQDLEGS